MKSKARLKKIERVAEAANVMTNSPRTFIIFEDKTADARRQDERIGTIQGTDEKMTLAEWQRGKKSNDTEITIRFVDGKPEFTLTMGRYSATLGDVDLSKI